MQVIHSRADANTRGLRQTVIDVSLSSQNASSFPARFSRTGETKSSSQPNAETDTFPLPLAPTPTELGRAARNLRERPENDDRSRPCSRRCVSDTRIPPDTDTPSDATLSLPPGDEIVVVVKKARPVALNVPTNSPAAANKG